MILKAILPAAFLAALGAASGASALTITVEPGSNLALFSYDFDAATRTINVYETWGAATSSSATLRFDDWTYGGSSWTLNTYITNESGASWGSFAHELFNSQKQTSVDNDGLSFAQFGSPYRPRSSDVFGNVTADEHQNRDYLLFDDGSVASGETVLFSYGITARRSSNVSPFFLRQAEFLDVVPEPATWALLVAGFGFVGLSLRRRRTTLDSVYA